ncbi:MAG: nucleotidyltransferase family protein [Paramuribaculum sp.]|nr:nucleotidyltransferase family protein [Paramuribaculum sp.]
MAFFKQYGLEGVLLKGQGVARYYREPQMRHSGDIDFYVGRKNYKKAVALCKEKLIGDKGKWEKIGIHFTFKMRGVQIEIHRLASRMSSPFRNRRFQNWIVEQLEYSPDRRILTLDNTDITLPSYDFDAIFIFYHAWRHYIMGGIGMRQLCDWAMIFHTHAEDIDIPKLKHHIQRFGIIKEWQLFACIAVNHLGVPKDKIPLYDPSYSEKSEKIFQEIMDGGNFGFYTVANTRTPMLGYGLRHGLGKVRNITGYFISLFPLIPVEATFLYFHRLFHGTIDLIKRSRHKSDN